MSFEYMQAPEWQDLDDDAKEYVINSSFAEDIEAAPEWESLPDDAKEYARNSYFSEAKRTEESLTKDYVDYDRSFPADMVSRIARGGLGVLESVAGGMRMTDLDPTEDTGFLPRAGVAITNFAEKAREKYDIFKPDIGEAGGEGFLKRGVGGAAESLGPSLTPLGVGAAVGAVNPLAGFIAGGATMFGTFFMGEYQKAYDEASEHLRRQGLPEQEIEDKASKHALISSGAEFFGEVGGDFAAMLTLGLIGKRFAKQGIKQTIKSLLKGNGLIKGLAKAMPFEVGSEVATAYFQTESARELGLTDGSTKDAMIEAVLPAIILSGIFGLSVRGIQIAEAHGLYNDLNSDDIEVRSKAVDAVASRLTKEEAKKWYETAQPFIDSGQKMPLDQAIVDMTIEGLDIGGEDVVEEQPSRTINDVAKDIEETELFTPENDAANDEFIDRIIAGESVEPDVVTEETTQETAPEDTMDAVPEVVPEEPMGEVAPKEKVPEYAPELLERIDVDVKAFDESSGEIITVKENANVALSEIDTQSETYYSLLECVG